MIKSDAQRERTLVQIEGFRKALAQAEKQTSGKRSVAVRASYESMIRQLEDEVREYDHLKAGAFKLPRVDRLDQIAPSIVKLRIAKGVSQTELARRLGVSKQVISRYEESDYQTVAIARLQEILDAIGVKTLVTLSLSA
jgi:HTH-type transcriptional regulator/antitoxin HigA